MYRDYKIFTDRQDAGIQLGKKLEKKFKAAEVVVLGIPRGGVEVAYHVAKMLNSRLSVIVSKKLPYPGQEELAFGAISEDGSVFLTSLAKNLNPETIEKIKTEQLQEIQRRVNQYRQGAPLPDMRGKTVILVDDGIATGSTIVPAIKLCKNQNAKTVIVAAPVSGKRYVPEIRDLADEVIVDLQPDDFFAVGQVYEDFHGLEDDEVLLYLRKFEEERPGSGSSIIF